MITQFISPEEELAATRELRRIADDVLNNQKTNN
mgnify:CR=1 FL=1